MFWVDDQTTQKVLVGGLSLARKSATNSSTSCSQEMHSREVEEAKVLIKKQIIELEEAKCLIEEQRRTSQLHAE